MSSRREVLIRILAPLQRKRFISNKKSHIEMLKMALFDCAVNEKRLQCWRRTGHLPPFFVPTPGGFDSSRAPTPGNLPSKAKNARGSGRGGGVGGWRRWNWLMHYGGKKMKRKREWSSSLQRFSQTVYIPKGLAHSIPAENIEMTSINAVYSITNYKLSLSVCLPFLRTLFGEISEIRRKVCLKFYARILHKFI